MESKEDLDLKKTIQYNSEILSLEIQHLEQQMWENNNFCKCGASSLKKCNCSKEKRERFVERVNRKKSKDLGEKGAKILMASQEVS